MEEGYVVPFADLALEAMGKAFQIWEPYAADLGFSFRNVTVVFVDPPGSEIDFDFEIHEQGKGVGAAHASFVAGKDGKAQWVSEGLQVEAVVAPKEILPEIDVRVQADGVVLGHWSTAASQMNFCAESQDMAYVSKVTIPGKDEDVVTTDMPLEHVFLTYECSPSTLTMVYTGPTPVDGPAPTWVLDRVK